MNRKQYQTRAGFTVAELLVVMGIIAFLIAISVVVVGDVIGSAKASATIATIKKVDALLTTRMHDFQRWLADVEGDKNVIFNGGQPLGGNDDARKLVLGQKNYFRAHFPQIFGESVSPISASASHVSTTESSECLYYFLTQGESFGATPVGEDTFSSSEVADTDGDGLKEFIDGWGRPLRFYRWPTRLVRGGPWSLDTPYTPQKIATDLLNSIPVETSNFNAIQDPDDTLGLIEAGVPSDFSADEFESNYHTLDTWHAPLIVSLGLDGLLGLNEPTDYSSTFGYLANPAADPSGADDNITNLNIRAGDK